MPESHYNAAKSWGWQLVTILARFAEQKSQRRTKVTRSGGSLDNREIRENATIRESGAAKNICRQACYDLLISRNSQVRAKAQ
jgi:hypothetical protein